MKFDENTAAILRITHPARKTLGLEPIDEAGDGRRRQAGVRRDFSGRKGSKPINDADSILFGQAQPEVLGHGVEEHHGGVALLAPDAQHSLDLIRTGDRGSAALA